MLLLKMKPATITLLIIGILITPIILGIFFQSEFIYLSRIVVILECYLVFVYMFNLGYHLRKKMISNLNTPYNRRYYLFISSIIATAIYIPVFTFEIIPIQYLLPFHFILMLLMLHAVLLIMQLLISVERKQIVHIKELFNIIKRNFKKKGFVFIYMWDIQKRVNKIFEGNQ